MKRILILTALAATLVATAMASPVAGGPPPLPAITVAPDSGRPGDAFTVSGSECGRQEQNDQAAGRSTGGRFAPRGNIPIDFSVSVAVAFPAPTATTTTPNTNGDWSVNFVVPPGTPPGVYEVSAACLFTPIDRAGAGGPAPSTPYPSGTYTVIGDPATPGAPPAAPVPGAPRFTG